MNEQFEIPKELAESVKRYQEDDDKARMVVDKMINVLKNEFNTDDARDKHILQWILPRFIGKNLLKEFKESNFMIEDHFIKDIHEGYTESHICPRLVEVLNFLWDNQKEKSAEYCGGYYFEKYIDNEKMRVSIVNDTKTCLEKSIFLIVEDKRWSNIHVRAVYRDDNSDYPEARYIHKPNLKFWEDRGFVVDFVEELHHTNLGSVYGDIRDKGYVLSFNTRDMKVERSITFHNEMDHFARLMEYMMESLEEENK